MCRGLLQEGIGDGGRREVIAARIILGQGPRRAHVDESGRRRHGDDARQLQVADAQRLDEPPVLAHPDG